MGARLRVRLNDEEQRTLCDLRKSTRIPQRVKDRAEAIRLSHHGMYVEKIAAYLGWNVRTVRETLNRWNSNGLASLWDKPRKRLENRCQSEDRNVLASRSLIMTVQSVEVASRKS